MSTDNATMSDTTTYTETELKAMKRSQLWQLFTKLGLGVTREKNTGWLVEQILAAQGGTPAADDALTPEPAVDPTPNAEPTEGMAAPEAEVAVTPSSEPAPAENEAVEVAEPLAAPASAQDTDDDTSAAAEAPTAANEPAADCDCLPDTDLAESGDSQDPVGLQRRPRDMTTDELRQLYVQEVGRPTGSDNRAYLIWKINEARKGRVPVGPVQRQAKRDADVKMMVLPLRMAEPDVEAIDGAWKRLGFKSRMAFIREAMGLALEARGEGEAAKAARNG